MQNLARRKALLAIGREIQDIEAKMASAKKKSGITVLQTMKQDYHHNCHSAVYGGMHQIPRLDKTANGGYCTICLQKLPMGR